MVETHRNVGKQGRGLGRDFRRLFVIPRNEVFLACPDDERSSEEWEESLCSPKSCLFSSI